MTILTRPSTSCLVRFDVGCDNRRGIIDDSNATEMGLHPPGPDVDDDELDCSTGPVSVVASRSPVTAIIESS